MRKTPPLNCRAVTSFRGAGDICSLEGRVHLVYCGVCGAIGSSALRPKNSPQATSHKDTLEKGTKRLGDFKRIIPRGRKSARCFFAFNTDFNNCDLYGLNMKTRRIE